MPRERQMDSGQSNELRCLIVTGTLRHMLTAVPEFPSAIESTGRCCGCGQTSTDWFRYDFNCSNELCSDVFPQYRLIMTGNRKMDLGGNSQNKKQYFSYGIVYFPTRAKH